MNGKLPDSSRLGLVLAWWHRYLERDAGFRRRHEGALTPSGAGPPAQRERALDLALLDLFIDPTGASRPLDRLARQGLQQTIRERLGEFAASARGATAIRRMRSICPRPSAISCPRSRSGCVNWVLGAIATGRLRALPMLLGVWVWFSRPWVPWA